MSEKYRPDHNSGSQIGLGLEFGLGESVRLCELKLGTRFIQRGTGAEGRLVELGNGSATVAVLKANGKWQRTTWSLETRVSPLAT